jgi:hypothetical protein
MATRKVQTGRMGPLVQMCVSASRNWVLKRFRVSLRIALAMMADARRDSDNMILGMVTCTVYQAIVGLGLNRDTDKPRHSHATVVLPCSSSTQGSGTETWAPEHGSSLSKIKYEPALRNPPRFSLVHLGYKFGSPHPQKHSSGVMLLRTLHPASLYACATPSQRVLPLYWDILHRFARHPILFLFRGVPRARPLSPVYASTDNRR